MRTSLLDLLAKVFHIFIDKVPPIKATALIEHM